MIIKVFILAAVAVSCSNGIWMARNTLRPAEIQALLKAHNDYRASVGASNMLKLKWDPELAQLAEGHVQHCAVKHTNMDLPDGKRSGQNLAASSGTSYDVVDGVKGWIGEIKDYNLATLTCQGGWKPCGHLTQVISAHTRWIGCAVNRNCDGKWKSLLICNYYPGNAIKSTFAHGPACSACPAGKCDEGLCVCNNPDCGKHGSFDLKTCSCKCDKMFSGAACDKKTCPPKDKWMCGNHYPKSYCTKFSNVPVDCPYMCGVC